ncbi:MAG: hypothetical protein EZS28_025669 [Streblomastix strix]|uniref:RNase III domain-containing protein n=1 Tax=Streblomastix strix TaxID=222440 RepID=A0A5J4V8I9_9EUKA|nr:MAG: hypothetical protein EZS28_025669 [Streblomastix strix]
MDKNVGMMTRRVRLGLRERIIELKTEVLKHCFKFGSSEFEVEEFHGDAVLEYRMSLAILDRQRNLTEIELTSFRTQSVKNQTLELVFDKLEIYNKVMTKEEQDKFEIARNELNARKRIGNDSLKAWKIKADVIECIIGALYQAQSRGTRMPSQDEIQAREALIMLIDEIYLQGQLFFREQRRDIWRAMNMNIEAPPVMLDVNGEPLYRLPPQIQQKYGQQQQGINRQM